jgi:hypothetical protein
MEISEAIKELKEIRGDDNLSPFKVAESLDIAISSLEAWDKVIQEVSDIKYRESLNHDSFDEYSEGRYDVASHILRIINKYLNEVQRS